MALTLACAACTPPPPAVCSNDVLPGDLPSVDRELTPRESKRVIDAMASTRDPKQDANPRPLATSPDGRWSEVPLAARLAAKEVEMAVVTVTPEKDGLRIAIIALNDDHGEMVVTGDAMHGVTGVTATLGLFGERTQDAERLATAFRAKLRELGAIPRPAPMPQTSTPLVQ